MGVLLSWTPHFLTIVSHTQRYYHLWRTVKPNEVLTEKKTCVQPPSMVDGLLILSFWGLSLQCMGQIFPKFGVIHFTWVLDMVQNLLHPQDRQLALLVPRWWKANSILLRLKILNCCGRQFPLQIFTQNRMIIRYNKWFHMIQSVSICFLVGWKHKPECQGAVGLDDRGSWWAPWRRHLWKDWGLSFAPSIT